MRRSQSVFVSSTVFRRKSIHLKEKLLENSRWKTNFCKVEEISGVFGSATAAALPREDAEGRGRGRSGGGGWPARDSSTRGRVAATAGGVATRGRGRGRGAECSVVLRPTDPLDNASTGGHWPSSRAKFALARPSRRCRVSRLESKIIPSREEFLDRARVSVSRFLGACRGTDRPSRPIDVRWRWTEVRKPAKTELTDCQSGMPELLSHWSIRCSRIWRNLLRGSVYARPSRDEKLQRLEKGLAGFLTNEYDRERVSQQISWV